MKTFRKQDRRSAVVRRMRQSANQSAVRVGPIQRARVREVLQEKRPQSKLTLGVPNDVYEKEADRIADEVMSMPDQTGGESEQVVHRLAGDQVGRECTECEADLQRQPVEEEEEEELQAKEQPGETPVMSDTAEAGIRSLEGGGEPLTPSLRGFFEPRFGYDFSSVRVHRDAPAAEIAGAINARAYTLGSDVVFGKGQYVPESGEGRRLMAHELAHVIQQTGGDSAEHEQD